jgi:hypothetical protein
VLNGNLFTFNSFNDALNESYYIRTSGNEGKHFRVHVVYRGTLVTKLSSFPSKFAIFTIFITIFHISVVKLTDVLMFTVRLYKG